MSEYRLSLGTEGIVYGEYAIEMMGRDPIGPLLKWDNDGRIYRVAKDQSDAIRAEVDEHGVYTLIYIAFGGTRPVTQTKSAAGLSTRRDSLLALGETMDYLDSKICPNCRDVLDETAPGIYECSNGYCGLSPKFGHFEPVVYRDEEII